MDVTSPLAHESRMGTRAISLYIEPPTHHFRNDGLFNITLCRFGGDQLLAPWVYLREFFTARGIDVHTGDLLPRDDADILKVYVSVGNVETYRTLSSRQDIVLSAFLAMECPIVDPSLYRDLPEVQRYFKRLLSWSDSSSLHQFVGVPLRCETFRWPQSFESVHEEIWNREDRDFLVMINANKLPRVYWQELYTERLRAVEYFSRTNEIDLFGVGWDGPPYRVGQTWAPYLVQRARRALEHQWQRVRPNPVLEAARRVYRGPALSKSETLGKYTFAVCFENMILKGWITEKIFDCFFAGTIPIYWGAPDIQEYVPPECFIDMRHFGGYEELHSYLRSFGEKEVQRYKENAREYLKSPQFRPFTKDAFVELFARIVEDDTGIRLT